MDTPVKVEDPMIYVDDKNSKMDVYVQSNTDITLELEIKHTYLNKAVLCIQPKLQNVSTMYVDLLYVATST